MLTRRDLLKQLLQDLQDNQIEPLGLVVNQNTDPSFRQMSSTMTIPPPRPIDARPGSIPYTLR